MVSAITRTRPQRSASTPHSIAAAQPTMKSENITPPATAIAPGLGVRPEAARSSERAGTIT